MKWCFGHGLLASLRHYCGVVYSSIHIAMQCNRPLSARSQLVAGEDGKGSRCVEGASRKRQKSVKKKWGAERNQPEEGGLDYEKLDEYGSMVDARS